MFRRLVTGVPVFLRSRRVVVVVLSLVVVALVAVITLVPAAWSSRRASSLGPRRFAPPFPVTSDPVIASAVTRSRWTQYADYHTVNIGRVERPARLFTGRRQWQRQIAVPPGGARWEVVIGAVDGRAVVRTGRAGTVPSQQSVVADTWTRVTLYLDPADGPSQSVAVDVEVAAGGVAAWSSELVTPLDAREDRPDIILISLDTVRRDQLTPYVPDLPTTPALDDLAREAVTFDQAVSTSSWTIASHAALFTGHFPADALGYTGGVSAQELTLPEIFAARGYRTFGVSGGPYTDPRWGLHQGFDEYVTSAERENARDATSRAIAWMETTRQRPVFLFLNYFNAHEPLVLSPQVRAATGVTEDVPADMWHDIDDRRTAITPAVRQRLMTAYRAELTAIDQELGRLFDYVRRKRHWASTLVIVWGDHGQLLGERGSIGHAYTLDEELIRVPLIIKSPDEDALRPGAYAHPIQNDDLFALCQTLGGISNRDGDEIARAIRAQTPFRRLTYSKIHHDPLPALTAHPRWRSATQWAVSDGEMKIVRDLEGRSFAYDLSGGEERAATLPAGDASLMSALQRFQQWSDRNNSEQALGPLSTEEIERLRALGYVR